MDAPRHHRAGVWAVAFAFLSVLALSTVPTPLYPIYQDRDGFSDLLITVIFAAYAVGVIAALFLLGHISDWLGRRRTLVPALLLSVVSAAIFLVWRDVPGLLIGRVLSGLSVGVVTATATAYLTELHVSPQRSQLLATVVNNGGLGLGPLVAGVLAETVDSPLTVPYVVFGVFVALAAVAVAFVPETVTRPARRPAYRPQQVAVPHAHRERYFGAAAGGFVSFAAFGLFTSLAPTFMAGTLGHTSHALAGVPAFAAFGAAIVAQLLTQAWAVQRLLGTGMAALSAGLALVVTGAWIPSLGLFLAGGAIAGAGAGLLFKGGIMTASALAEPARRAEALAGYFLAGYAGLAVPVVGLGVMREFLEPQVALLAFGALLLAGLAASAQSLLARRAVAS